jgi:hypothetical protein
MGQIRDQGIFTLNYEDYRGRSVFDDIMRYFKIKGEMDSDYYVWVLREDGYEKCLSECYATEKKEWHSVAKHGYPSIPQLILGHKDYEIIELTENDAFLEMV